MAAKKGALAGRYRLLEPAGRLPGGTAWRAKDELLDRFVVVEQLPPGCPFDAAHSDRVRAKAIRDARVAVRLHHPHVVVVHDVFEHDLTPYVVTEDLAAGTLAELVERRGSFPPDRVAALGAQLASALAAAHAEGILHRGFGPDKVLVTADGTAKITGFGLGTGGFPAPEAAGGSSAGCPSDVYSLGATLYFALEGRVPGTAVPPRTRGPVLDAVLDLVRPEPAARPSMAEAGRTLTDLAVSRPLAVIPARSARSRTRVLVTGTVLVVALGTAVTTRAALRRPASRSSARTRRIHS
ncbi:protein kinase [Amycolatopsis sp. DG1A-15b]|uniref:protein kinase domain-containing protein n=1 Tax=Amycolatopsis sp. DG1A-15b TaxID=3052846 RepID=UPI00255B43E6|nr:protein kinase [Amycolatopsis sp. DG1A-15b]WIX89950.1 protein kinase [Amycolatopsis sp. DG1A-15b]